MALMHDPDAITWVDWVESPAISKGTRYTRKHLVALWARANSLDPQNVLSPDQVLAKIYLEETTPYQTANVLFRYLRELHQKHSTIREYHSMLGGEGKRGYGGSFFVDVLGETNFSPKKYEKLCPIGAGEGEEANITEKKQPTLGEMEYILRDLADNRERALIGGMAIAGFRINEWVSRKLSDLQRRPDGHAMIRLQAGSTKKRYTRHAFLTKEVVDWIDLSHKGLTVNGADTWIFPGELGKHLDKRQGYVLVKKLFRKAGLADTEGEIYSPQSFRGFAENLLGRTGLTEKFVRLIVGHANEVDRAYKGDVESEWVAKCGHITLIKPPAELVKTHEIETNRRIDALETTLAQLVKAVLEGNPDKKKIAERWNKEHQLEDKSIPTAIEPADDARTATSN